MLLASLVFDLSAQDINPEIFRKNIDILYEAADKGFKEIKGDENGTTDKGDVKFHAKRKVSGAMDTYIKVDEETTHTYVALFEVKDNTAAKEQVELMATLIHEQIGGKGFKRSTGTDMSFEGYRKQTVEYDSENIDDLGHHPSFSVGILRGTNPPVISMEINEPLWK